MLTLIFSVIISAGLSGVVHTSPLLFQPPKIIGSSPESVSLITGDTLLLSCIVEAHSPPTAKIIKLNEDSHNSIDDIYDILDFDISSNSVEDNLIEVTLTQVVSATDSGWYRCKATNKYGETHADFFVEVFDDNFPFVLDSDLLEKELGGGPVSSGPASESGARSSGPVSGGSTMKTGAVSKSGALSSGPVSKSGALPTEGRGTTEGHGTTEPLTMEPENPSQTTPYYYRFI